MKLSFITLLFCLATFNLVAQQKHSSTDSTSFANYTSEVENQRHAFERQKEYQGIDTLLRHWIQRFDALPSKVKPDFKHWQATMYYNLACCNALSNHKKTALTFFEKAAKYGYHNYQGTIHDSDLESLRQEKSYLATLQIIRERGDVGYILRTSGTYGDKLQRSLPKFSYQSANAPVLVSFKNKFNLDSVAGNGDEISRIKNLSLWVHNNVRYDGENQVNPEHKNGLDLIEVCKTEHRGVNCRMMATILKDVYLAEGFQARAITCMPKDIADTDCHVIDIVWSKTFNKWVWMDPANYAYVTNKQGDLLSIEEVRNKLYNDQANDLVLNKDANWNNELKRTQDWYLDYYMSKNLYWLQCTASSEWDLETVKTSKPLVSYISLYPKGYTSTKNQQGTAGVNKVKYATNNAAYFWQKP